ncbi:MAG: hypothetical protein QOC68_3040 [Solirubrobacteraceae bacterium]|jgi:MFS family permease|nr:hypothetical protein [Solirubrobacteraceae bacterium]
MDNLLGWLPLIGLLATGIALGITARRLGQRGRRALYLAPLAIAALSAMLIWRSPPCQDFLDGPCQENWVGAAALVGVFIALPLTILAAATLALTRAAQGARST